MPRAKRDVRARGVTRSLGGGRAPRLTCVCCERYLPRDAIAQIRRKPVQTGPMKGKPCAVCGECYAPGGLWWTGALRRVRFVADDPGGLWKSGDEAHDYGWESTLEEDHPDFVPVRALQLADGQWLGVTDPFGRGLVKTVYGPEVRA